MTDSAEHPPGPLRIYRKNDQSGTIEQIGEVVPNDTFRCGGQILGNPPSELFCKRHAGQYGYDW